MLMVAHGQLRPLPAGEEQDKELGTRLAAEAGLWGEHLGA